MRYIKLYVDGTLVKDDSGSDPKQIISLELIDEEDEPVSELTIKALKSILDYVTLKNGQVVQLYKSDDNITYKRIFYGKIDNYIQDGATYDITCKNELIDLVKKNVNTIYDSSVSASAGIISDIAIDLVETYGELTADIQDSGTTDTIDIFRCNNADIYERVKTLISDSLDWAFYYDSEAREVKGEPRGFTDSGITLTTSDNIIGIPSWEFDTSYLINDLRVDGATVDTTITESGQVGVTSGYTTSSILLTKTPNSAEVLMDSSDPPTTQLVGGSKDASTGNDYYIDSDNKKIISTSTFTTNDYAIIHYIWSSPVPIHMVNQDSIDNYGIAQTTLSLTDITSVADAESRAANILTKRSIPFIIGKLKIKNMDLKVGQMVNVQDNITSETVSGDYMITKITDDYPSGFMEIEVGDKTWRMADWEENTESRLKLLEEQFVENQDILLELREFSNTSLTNFEKLTPRYRKILTNTILGNNIFILGNSTYGILGTSQLGDSDLGADTDYYIQQYEDTYEENFIGDDFKGSSTTATWLNNGEITL